MRAAVGIISWHDGNAAIQRTVESAEHFADEIIIAEGPIAAYPGDLPNSLSTPDRTDFENKVFLHSQHIWSTQSAKRDFCLSYARLFKCDWLLFLDTDEYLVNADELWSWLMLLYKDELAAPILWKNEEESSSSIVAPWKLINVNQCKAIVSRSYVVKTHDGDTVNLCDFDNADQRHQVVSPALVELWPHIVHDPSIRPEWRKSFRLGPVEDAMEAMPEKASPFKCPQLPIHNGVTR